MSAERRRALVVGLIAGLVFAGTYTVDLVVGPRSESPSAEERASRRRARGGVGAGRDGGLASREALDDGGAGAPRRCALVIVEDLGGRPVLAEVISRGRDATGGLSDRVTQTTDAAGRVEVCAPDGSALFLRASTGDGRWGIRGEYPRRWEERELRLRVSRPCVVRGVVVDDRGQPVGNAELWNSSYVGGLDGSPDYLSTGSTHGHAIEAVRTDADGRFELQLIGLRLFQVAARAPGFARTWAGPFAGRPGESYETEIALRRTVDLEVTVSHDGAPIPGATIYLSRTRVHERSERHELPDGHLIVQGRHPDAEFDLGVVAPGFVEVYRRAVPVGAHTIELERGARVRVPFEVDPVLSPCFDAERFFPDRPVGIPFLTSVHGRIEQGDETSMASSREPTGELVFEGVLPGPSQLSIYVQSAVYEAPIDVRLPETHAPLARLSLDDDKGILRVSAPSPDASYSILHEDGRHGSSSGMAGATAVCHALASGRYRFETGGAERWVRVAAGRVTEVEAQPRPPDPPGQPPIRGTCGPPLEVQGVDALTVVELTPEADGRVLPGDVIVDVEGEGGLVGRLYGPPSTTVRALIERPDGSRAWVVLERTPCHDDP